jgi:hypothetical protein
MGIERSHIPVFSATNAGNNIADRSPTQYSLVPEWAIELQPYWLTELSQRIIENDRRK